MKELIEIKIVDFVVVGVMIGGIEDPEGFGSGSAAHGVRNLAD